MDEVGAIPWVLILIGIVVLGLALVAGLIMNRRRLSAREKAEQQRKTYENFRADEGVR